MCSHDKKLSFLVTILILVQYVSTKLNNTESTLQLVHVVFRHGDRTVIKTLYPKDPHINETYYPYGLGGLTLEGKRKEYRLGKVLRERYDRFLGKLYIPDTVEAWSSNTTRTKMSLQLVLAGLFPPSKEQLLEPDVNWQPVTFNTLPEAEDTLFFGLDCPNFEKLLSELLTSPKLTSQFKLYTKEFEYISENTGLDVKNFWDVFFLYLGLTTQEEFGLTLPKWTEKVYPQLLKNFAIKSYEILTATTEMRRITSGTLVKKIIDDSKSKLNGNSNKKIFLYSGHELNMAYLLHTLEVFKPHIPPYGSYILFELHRINNVDGIKIYYQDYSSSEPKLLKLPACAEFCPLNNFILLLEEYFPENNSCKGV